MFTQEDLKQIESKGITVAQVESQLEDFKNGFPFLKLKSAAAIGNGILACNDAECDSYISAWESYKSEGKDIVKFVPASGAASRMFKDLFAFADAAYDVPTTDFEKKFFEHIRQFAFFCQLNDACVKNQGCGIDELLQKGQYKAVVNNLLGEEGLNYGQLPKGLLEFHTYADVSRTPVEEHLVEGALYAGSKGVVAIHFTVSHEHRALFEQKIKSVLPIYEKEFGVKYEVSMSEQLPSTDTIAANVDNTPFRDDKGRLVFRPGGHGALIANLNKIDADIVFVKNIDNVVPDRIKDDTVKYKKVLAGVLVSLQKQAFEYLEQLESGTYSHDTLEKIIRFVQRNLCCRNEDIKNLEDADLVIYLKNKLNRPMRVCGVVKNVGEPGGGPFLTYNSDGSVSSQILESSQIDKSNQEYVDMFVKGTHFNPVDLVCALKNYKGEKYDLTRYVDKSTGFISSKSKSGRELKALELPGLWNGAMSDWNTVFVEVPLSTFNPVKTVNDLLREQHQ